MAVLCKGNIFLFCISETIVSRNNDSKCIFILQDNGVLVRRCEAWKT